MARRTHAMKTRAMSARSTSTTSTSTLCLSTPSTNNASLSLLDLPAEIRQMIYAEVFRNTKVQIHNTATDMSKSWTGECWESKRKDHTNLLATAKVVRQEATPLFLREADFRICCDKCWIRDSTDRFEPPHVNYLIIESSEPWNSYTDWSRIRSVLPILNRHLERCGEMSTLICDITLHDDVYARELFRTFLSKGLDHAHNFRVKLALPHNAARFNILFKKTKILREVESLEYLCQRRTKQLIEYLDKLSIQICEPIRAPPETEPIIQSAWFDEWYNFYFKGNSCHCEPCQASEKIVMNRYIQEHMAKKSE